jgi:hypothetical protein
LKPPRSYQARSQLDGRRLGSKIAVAPEIG